MRILFVINCFSYGGAEKLVFDLARSISSGCKQVGVAALYRMDNEAEERMQQSLNANGVTTYILDKRARSDRISAIRKLCTIVKDDNFQLIHAHCSVPMYISKIAGCITGAKVVCTVHSTRGYKPLPEKLTEWMVQSYVSIGQAAEEYMLNALGINRNKITRIYNAVDTEMFQPGERISGFWKNWGFDDTAPVIVNIGRVVPPKNQLCLLRALDKCCRNGTPIQCAILGDYDISSETYKTLQEYIRNNRLEESVRFLGQQDDVPAFLHNSDCFVMTSWYEGLSVSFLEAVLCGTPIITTDMPFVRELQQFGRSATIIPQDDFDTLANTLLSKCYAPTSEETMVLFRNKFSLAHFAEAHLKLYFQIIKGK